MNLLSRIFSSRKKPDTGVFDAILQPEKPFYAIGDIHGCDGLLIRLLDKIKKDDKTRNTDIVFVGDYVDRGEESAAVLRRLFAMSEDSTSTSVTCLMGNHEDMMLKFIDNPIERGPRWLQYGGLQTLASFGVRGITTTTTGIALEEARDKLAFDMGEPLIAWLRDLPTFWQSGNIAVVHAGADPEVAINAQQSRVLKWGHKAFAHQLRTDGIWVVHGHTIVDQANATDGRIAIDTGAYATGQLTAAQISDQEVQFLKA